MESKDIIECHRLEMPNGKFFFVLSGDLKYLADMINTFSIKVTKVEANRELALDLPLIVEYLNSPIGNQEDFINEKNKLVEENKQKADSNIAWVHGILENNKAITIEQVSEELSISDAKSKKIIEDVRKSLKLQGKLVKRTGTTYKLFEKKKNGKENTKF